MGQDEPEDEDEPGLSFFVPAEQEAGTYANALVVWHTPYEFTLDFGAMQPPQPVDEDDLDSAVVRPCGVVSRIRLPLTRMFDVLRALNASMTEYEAEWVRSTGPNHRRRDMKIFRPITSGMRNLVPSKPIPPVTYVSEKQAGTWYTARELPPEKPDEKS